MTRFRLNAGRPASFHTGGPSAPSVKPAAEIRIRRIKRNNELPDVPLTCGCKVPWPIITLLGSKPKNVMCDIHGWQTITKTTIERARKDLKCTTPSTPNPQPMIGPYPF